MILLNTTYSIDDSIAEAFEAFVRDTIAPAATHGRMKNITFGRIRSQAELNTITNCMSHSFALQMFAPSQLVMNNYVKNIEPAIIKQIADKFGIGVAMFSTAIDVIWTDSDGQ